MLFDECAVLGELHKSVRLDLDVTTEKYFMKSFLLIVSRAESAGWPGKAVRVGVV